MESFSDWLVSEMLLRGMTQAELSRLSGKAEPIISRLISGKNKPSNETLQAIAKALRLPVEVVYQRAGILIPTPANDDPNLSHIAKLLGELPSDDLEDIYAMILSKIERNKRKKG